MGKAALFVRPDSASDPANAQVFTSHPDPATDHLEMKSLMLQALSLAESGANISLAEASISTQGKTYTQGCVPPLQGQTKNPQLHLSPQS